jgi:hypothetical protein
MTATRRRAGRPEPSSAVRADRSGPGVVNPADGADWRKDATRDCDAGPAVNCCGGMVDSSGCVMLRTLPAVDELPVRLALRFSYTTLNQVGDDRITWIAVYPKAQAHADGFQEILLLAQVGPGQRMLTEPAAREGQAQFTAGDL